ncbi:UNVERIFIED_CONTAM: hypothetical protein Slati_2188900 [Sesamum latifolium]|uniref:DUF4283 domain-containing protein n=1 Tax=Sesamum latifolium TaxID=2727402 RepID=A0AAW2WVX3_9LAMI
MGGTPLSEVKVADDTGEVTEEGSGVPMEEIEVEVAAATKVEVAVDGSGVPLLEDVVVAPREEIGYRGNTTTSPGSQIARIGGPACEATSGRRSQGQPIILQQWKPGMALRKHKHTQVPVWLHLKHLPVEFYTNEGLSIIVSGIGRPLYQDAITKAFTRLDFARVCVILEYRR